MKKYWLNIIFCICFSVVFSQRKVTGEVFNNLKKPISNVLVNVKDTEISAYTNITGKFELEIPENKYTLLFFAEGYEDFSREINSEIGENIFVIMEERGREISELFVTVGRDITLNKLNIKSIENPIFTSTINSDLIKKRNVTSIEDALRSVTGINATSRYGGFMSFNIRGFTDYALFVDGVRDDRISFSWAPISNIVSAEKIEVLKGPESVLFGHSVLGGVINIVRKKTSHIQKGEVRFDYGSYNFYGAYMGVGGPISKKLRYRVDIGTTSTDGWRDSKVNTNNAILILDYIFTDKDIFQFSFQANKDKYATESGIPTDYDTLGEVKILKGIDRSTRYNHPDDILNHKRYDFVLKYTRKINNNMLFMNSTNYSDDNIFYISNDGGITVNSDQKTVERTSLGFVHHAKPIQNQIDFIYNFNISNSIKNKIVIGNYISFLDRKSNRLAIDGPGKTNTLDLYNPQVNTGYRDYYTSRINVRKESVNSYYTQNWLSFSEKIKLLLGIRFDSFDSNYWLEFYNELGNKIREQKSGEGIFNTFTYRGGVVYIPVNYLSFFGSYSTYFKPTRTFDTNGNVFNPEKGQQREFGIKIQNGKKIYINFSLFYILKHNILEKAGKDIFKRVGSVRSKGFEIDTEWKPLGNFSIKAGYSYTNANIKNAADKKRNGFFMQYVPKHLFNAWVDYSFEKTFLKNLGISVIANYVDKSFADTNNVYKTPSYFLVDKVVYYKLNKKVRLGLNINNIFHEKYFSSSILNFDVDPQRVMVVPGMGRNYKISLGYQF